ncbi:MAG: hypothetical protein IH989_04885 [Planctomycetes bacterium]|nr:hypothetical protein [Planctomycetota bacterium]
MELAFPGAAAGQPVDAATSRQWFDWLTVNGFAIDRCGFNPLDSTIVLDVPDDESLKRLTDAGFSLTRTLRGGVSERTAQTDPQYFDPVEVGAMIAQVAADHPTITRVFLAGTTFEGRNIFALEISDRPGVDEDEPAIQFNAQHHAREVATSHVVMDVVNTLTDGYGVDATITGWVNDFKTVCVPMVNPDGIQFVFNGSSLWRKNRRVYAGGCTGVDLNRNYPYRWGPDRCGSTTSCSGVTYKGPSSASELETQAMMALADSFKFVMATSYHAFGRFIDYPYACSTGSPSEFMPEHGVIDEMMNGVADAIDAVDSVPRYTVFSPTSAGALSGDDTSWYYAHMGVYSFIIEVGTSFEPAFSQVAGIVNRNRSGWQYMYDRLGQARIDVHVTDACTDEPIEADVTLTDFAFDTGELARRTFLPFGRWTFVVEANQPYTVRVNESGYITQDVNVNVGNAPASVDIALVPTSLCEPLPIPAASTWGVVAFLLSVLSAGTLILRSPHRTGLP